MEIRNGDVIAIPESGSTEHVKENAAAFSLTLTPDGDVRWRCATVAAGSAFTIRTAVSYPVPQSRKPSGRGRMVTVRRAAVPSP
jgi:hypothetical protein